MKSLLSTLVIIMLLAHLVTGGWYVKKCANKLGNCRSKCRNGEQPKEPATSMCPKGKQCCVLDLKVSGQCGGVDTKAPGGGSTKAPAAGNAGGTTPAKKSGSPAASTPQATTAAP